MKNILLYIIALISFLLASCSSESPVSDVVNPNTGLRKATFTLTGIASETTEMSLKSASLEELNIQHLEYWVYKTEDIQSLYVSEKPVLHKVLKKEDFGKSIIIELLDNDYTIIFYATDEAVELKEGGERTPYVRAVDVRHQMFSAKKQFVVNEQKPEVNESIHLERIIGKIELVIEDLENLPAEVKSITPVMTGYTRIMVTPVMPVSPCEINLIHRHVFLEEKNIMPTIPRSQFASINKDNPIEFYILPPMYNPETVSGLSAVDYMYIQGTKDENFYTLDMSRPLLEQNSQVVFMRKVGKFEVKANQIMRYTGKIGSFDGGDFEIIIDETWDEISVGIDE